MILSLQQGLAEDGLKVSLVKLCQWFEIPRRTMYYRSTKAAPKVREHFVRPIKAMIEENPPILVTSSCASLKDVHAGLWRLLHNKLEK